ncbi:type II toxin-antitoxin system toxin DNA ADP-ribosyl transferase DarT [Nonomuraea sp. NPDC003707]
MMDVQDPWLLHFTHVDNLGSVARTGLVADNLQPPLVVECAEQGIKELRRTRSVPLGPLGVVADYVPFYFAPRSPMLYRINSGGVRGYDQGQTPLVYLVTRLSAIAASNLAWVASDRNAALATARFTTTQRELATHIDWALMEAEYWANTDEDGSRVQRRMAELLVHERVPWMVFSRVYAHTESVAAVARKTLEGLGHRPSAEVRAHWYF